MVRGSRFAIRFHLGVVSVVSVPKCNHVGFLDGSRFAVRGAISPGCGVSCSSAPRCNHVDGSRFAVRGPISPGCAVGEGERESKKMSIDRSSARPLVDLPVTSVSATAGILSHCVCTRVNLFEIAARFFDSERVGKL